jgi:hypothetical protein
MIYQLPGNFPNVLHIPLTISVAGVLVTVGTFFTV